MSEQLKIKTRAVRNQFGKLSGSYAAELGPWSAIGTTKDEAIFILTERIEAAHRYDMHRRYLVTSDGTVFSLWHAFGSWGYDIIHTGKAGAQSPGSCLLGEKSQVDAYAAMKQHWEQMEEQCAAVAQ